MHPELLHLGPIVLPSYGAALGLAFVLGILLLRRRSPEYGIDRETAVDMGIWLILSGLLGAKLLLLVVEGPGYYLGSFRGLLELFRAGGVFYGGLLGALVAAVFFVKVKKVPFLAFADAAAPAVALGQAIGRIGCLTAGCCWGGSVLEAVGHHVHGLEGGRERRRPDRRPSPPDADLRGARAPGSRRTHPLVRKGARPGPHVLGLPRRSRDPPLRRRALPRRPAGDGPGHGPLHVAGDRDRPLRPRRRDLARRPEKADEPAEA
jgi:Prolipoprotein diacylglyceryltransferase